MKKLWIIAYGFRLEQGVYSYHNKVIDRSPVKWLHDARHYANGVDYVLLWALQVEDIEDIKLLADLV